MSTIGIAGLWFLLGSLSIVSPVFPQNAFLGGTVIAQLHFISGEVRGIRILYGEEPFTTSCEDALAKWRAEPAENGDELVVIHFRQPYLYEIGNTEEQMDLEAPDQSLPNPVFIAHPVYPPNALGDGSVVLRVDISDEGKVADVQVLKSMGVLTDASERAVRKWQFMPARDPQGKARPSHVYAVFVYRFPDTAD